MNLLDEVTLQDLAPDQRDIAEQVSLEAYIKLVKFCGGSSIYIQKADSIIRGVRDKKIIDSFNGYNYRELSRLYNLTESMIRQIVSEKKNELKSAPLKDQLCLFD